MAWFTRIPRELLTPDIRRFFIRINEANPELADQIATAFVRVLQAFPRANHWPQGAARICFGKKDIQAMRGNISLLVEDDGFRIRNATLGADVDNPVGNFGLQGQVIAPDAGWVRINLLGMTANEIRESVYAIYDMARNGGRYGNTLEFLEYLDRAEQE